MINESKWGNYNHLWGFHQLQNCMRQVKEIIQRSAKVGAPGLLNFITVDAYHFCTSLPAAFTQPGAPTLADFCTAPYPAC